MNRDIIHPPNIIIYMHEACKRLGISKGTMLRYEAIGLFPRPTRNRANGYRCFTQESIEQLRTMMLEKGEAM